MTFNDALAATTGVVPIARAMEKGWLMIGYLDGSVSITKDRRLVKLTSSHGLPSGDSKNGDRP